jgi:hypothetical protein
MEFKRRNKKIFKLFFHNLFMIWFFKKRKEVDEIKEETKKGFDLVKKDILSLSEWVKHLNNEKEKQKGDIETIKEDLSSIKEDLEGMKNVLAIMNELKNKQVFKTPKQVFEKQTGVYAVQTGVQTGVQTPNLNQFSVTERAILWVLLNSEVKLSYEDVAALLGKEKSTIRGQINSIKQKSESLISEEIEKNGKKRIYIPEEVKEKLLKRVKVRVKNKKEK